MASSSAAEEPEASRLHPEPEPSPGGPPPATAGLPRWALQPKVRAEAAAIALIVAVVVVGNVLYLSGHFDANPLSSYAALGTVVHPGVLGGSFTIDPNAGYTSQALGHLAAVDLVHGQLPWWNPYEGAGAPLAGEMQSAALFPPTLLLWFQGGQLAARLLLEAVAGIATLRLLQRLGVGRWVAAPLACAFALDGTFSWLMHAPSNVIATLPLLLVGIERARGAAVGDRRMGYGLIGVALALSVYAGFPETAYLDGILAAVWAIVRLPAGSRRALLRYAVKLGAGMLVGALLAAPVVVAFADYLPSATAGAHTADVFNLVHVTRSGAGALFFPYVFGPIFGFYQKSTTLGYFWSQIGGYLTTSLLVLDVLALWGRRQRPLRIGLAAWLVLALSRIYGIQPLWRIFDILPAMGHVGASRYLWPTVELAACVLAALALDDLRHALVPRWLGAAALVASAGIAAGTALAGRSILSSIARVAHASAYTKGSLAWGFAVVAVVGGATIVGRGRWRAALVGAVVVVDALAMFVLPDLSAPQHVTYDASLVTWLEAHAGLERVYTLGPLQPNYGSFFGVLQADINDAPRAEAYQRYIRHHLDPNVGVSFTGTEVKNPTGPTPLDALTHHLRSYEALGVRLVVVPAGTVTPASVASLGIDEVYADRLAEVLTLPSPAPYFSAGAGCRLSQETVTSVVARCGRATRLVRHQLWFPGTAATVTARGSRSPVLVRPAPAVAESVELPPGKSSVAFSYTPPHEVPAFAAFVLGLLALAVPVAVRRRAVRRFWQRKGPPPASTAGDSGLSALPPPAGEGVQ